MAPTFNLCQQAFTLSIMSGSVSGQKGTPSALAQQLDTALKAFFAANTALLGDWSIVWGPAIFQSSADQGSYPDNAMYVAYNAASSAYVVAIAGTNPNSGYDVTNEDLAVSTTAAWTGAFPSLGSYGIPSHTPALNPYVSTGTQLGVNNLLGLVDTVTTTQSLVAFLQSLSVSTTQASTIIFGGHSLGGALSPTLAAALFNTNGGPLSASNWGNVFVYPTAGPTPGNADFATMFSLLLPPANLAGVSGPAWVWNQNICNTLDVVPQAWVISTLQGIPTIYPQATWKSPPLALTLAVNHLVSISNKGAATGAGPYTAIANVQMTGTFNPDYPVSDLSSFEAQAGYQHNQAYQVLLGVTSAFSAPAPRASDPMVHAMLTPPTKEAALSPKR
jgi:hypothetical protein